MELCKGITHLEIDGDVHMMFFRLLFSGGRLWMGKSFFFGGVGEESVSGWRVGRGREGELLDKLLGKEWIERKLS